MYTQSLADSLRGLPHSFSPKLISRISGACYLGIIACGIFAEFIVRSSLIVPGDAQATASNIVASEQLFRFGIAADLLMLIFDAVLALTLYLLLSSVNKPTALLAMLFRAIHTAVVGSCLLNLYTALDIAASPLSANGLNLGYEQLMITFLNAHSNGYVLGLIFFGVHCSLLGYLLLKANNVPSILGVLMIIASLGYLIDGFGHVLMTNYSAYTEVFSTIVIIPAIVGELSFALWLLLRGFREESVTPTPLT